MPIIGYDRSLYWGTSIGKCEECERLYVWPQHKRSPLKGALCPIHLTQLEQSTHLLGLEYERFRITRPEYR